MRSASAGRQINFAAWPASSTLVASSEPYDAPRMRTLTADCMRAPPCSIALLEASDLGPPFSRGVFQAASFFQSYLGTTGSFHSRVDSYARAARSTSASPCIGPTICTDTGRPDRVRPQGTTAAGCCVRLNGNENGVQPRNLGRASSHSPGRFCLEGRYGHARRQQEIVALMELAHERSELAAPQHELLQLRHRDPCVLPRPASEAQDP
jgi:hypothetical protein